MNAAVYREEVAGELHSILRYWMSYAVDPRGGFLGRVDEADRPHLDAPKGLVMNSRILWAFSAAYRAVGLQLYLPFAQRAYDYLRRCFLDREYGGAFWSLDAAGRPLNPRKQIYGQAFCLYGLSEYYLATGEKQALDEAVSLFRLMDQKGLDKSEKGYSEAFARDWSILEDVRLSEKEANDPRTMNTHLHILEAYTNLFKAWPDPHLQNRIIQLLEVFDDHIIDGETGHLGLFFDEQWTVRSGLISFGHDIEAAWLLHEAALTAADAGWIAKTGDLSLKLAAAAAEGLDRDGGLWYEQERGIVVREKHWWPQAEAMVGFLQAWQLSGDVNWWQRSRDSWAFINKYIRHPAGREWYWGIASDHTPMPGEDKAGFWKCPYHNSRACMEILRRLMPV